MKVRPPQSIILDSTVDVVFHAMLLMAVFFLVAGHNRPGGGFIGGLVVGGALVLQLLSGRAMPGLIAKADPLSTMGVGLVLAAGTGLVPLAFGGQFLESASFTVDLPLVGTVKAFSVLIFDIGVFLVVVGMVLAELAALAPAPDDDEDDDLDPEWGDDDDDRHDDHHPSSRGVHP